MTQSDLSTLLDYHYWARDRLLAVMDALTPDQFTRDLGSSFPSVRDTLSHVHGAEWIWLTRLQGQSPAAPLPHERFTDTATVRSAWSETEAGFRAFVDGLEERDVDRTVEYRLLNGQPSASRIWQVVQHMVNHAAYHRGQVTTMLRQMGAATPQSMDLIAYYRERASA